MSATRRAQTAVAMLHVHRQSRARRSNAPRSWLVIFIRFYHRCYAIAGFRSVGSHVLVRNHLALAKSTDSILQPVRLASNFNALLSPYVCTRHIQADLVRQQLLKSFHCRYVNELCLLNRDIVYFSGGNKCVSSTFAPTRLLCESQA